MLVEAGFSSVEAIRIATLNGAIYMGRDSSIGSIAPGKDADIVLLSTDRLNLWPLNNAPGLVVNMMNPGDVDTVIIAGRVAKLGGAIIGLDWGRFSRLVDESRGYLFEKLGYKPDLFAEEFKLT